MIFRVVKVRTAKNDCLDFSAGKCFIESAELLIYNDKAVSIGEASNVEIEGLHTIEIITR